MNLSLLLVGCATPHYAQMTPQQLQFEAQKAQALLDQDCYNHETTFTTTQARDAANTQNAVCSLNKALAARKLRQIYALTTTPTPVHPQQPMTPPPVRTFCLPHLVYPAYVPGKPQQPPYVVGEDCVTQPATAAN